MQTIATLGSNIRLLAVQFHLKNEQVPSAVPAYSDFHKQTKNQVSSGGVRVMESTPDVMLNLFTHSAYQLVDAWHEFDEENWKYKTVRYVFCHPEHIYSDKLNLDFIARQEELLNSLASLTDNNLWQTMGHINPFFANGEATDKKVLMFDCNSRKATVKPNKQPVTVFRDGRDKLTNQGIGPKVTLIDKANRLNLIGDKVVIAAPETIPVQV